MKNAVNNPKIQILTEIKRSQGLSVLELCHRIGLSYMGIKQHCIALEREGYLDTWRRPKGMGRPEKAYRLTQTAQEFFPSEYRNFTTEILDSVQEVYGPSAVGKILFNIYRNEADKLKTRIKGPGLEEKMRQLAALREERGYMSEFYFNRNRGRQEVIEYNSPILLCLDRFPILRDLEKQLFENILGVKIQRHEERVSGLYKCAFTVA
ncbi:MAG: winged helix-turn-helix transcriptional regulator [Verrucomicrobiales bacterium]|nr:winged helix-turn-helix transcriptional regulator [Verrucomicrobiales bacterium]